VLVSHDSALIERTCERLIVLDGGEKIFDGPVAEGMPFYHRLMGTSDEVPPVAGEPPGARVAP
jgi:ABC-type polysaccharide/polyol phosphate transport system ATPase subunit